MSSINLFADYSSLTILALAFLAFTAGFIDSVVGGGGLIQIPALLINLPNSPLPILFGTNKIASLSGTSVAAYQYAKRIKYNFKVLLSIAFFSFIASNLGAKSLSLFNANLLKPFILILLILIAIYIFIKKDLGSIQTKTLPVRKQIIFGSLIGIVVGFYDGFFGPGTGSFLVLGFVVVLGFDFVTASAYSKMINCVTNVSALLVFIRQGNYLLELAVLMAICNIMGSIAGSRIALKKGNDFVRTIFFLVVTIMIARYSYDVFIKN
jgi:uncharacterized membrane protein YfcA